MDEIDDLWPQGLAKQLARSFPAGNRVRKAWNYCSRTHFRLPSRPSFGPVGGSRNGAGNK